MSDFRPFCQQAHSLHQAQLLPPFPEGHAGFLLKESFNRAFARAALPADLTKCPVVARVDGERLGNPPGPRVRQMRKLQRDHFYRFKLIQDYPYEVFPGSGACPQCTERTGMENQFAQQW